MRVFDNKPLIKTGYVAGTGDGIVTIDGKPAVRLVYALNKDMNVVAVSISAQSGQYLLKNLDPSQRYLVLCRDHTGVYDPACYDHIAPMNDKTGAEIGQLWHEIYGG